MNDALKNLQQQVKNAKLVIGSLQDQQKATEDFINEVLGQAPNEDKAEVLMLKMNMNKIMQKAKNGDLSYMNDLNAYTKKMTEKFTKKEDKNGNSSTK